MNASVPSSVPQILDDLRNGSGISNKEIAERLDVTVNTVRRWLEGKGTPNPTNEGKVRSLHSEVVSEPNTAFQPNLFNGAPELGEAIDTALRELREIFHRRGRFSSRNQVVDEVSKLLFSHVAPILAERNGISSSILDSDTSPAVALQEHVRRSFENCIGTHSDSNLNISEFKLKIEDNEDKLAKDIIQCINESVEPSVIIENKYSDIINDIFGKFLADSFYDEKQLGQYLTPPEVVSFMVELVFELMTEREVAQLRAGEMKGKFGYVLDPSCGAASFLAEFIRQAHKRFSFTEADSPRKAEWNRAVLEHTVGIDKSERMVRLALTNLALFGHSRANIYLENSIERDGEQRISHQMEDEVGLILTNPPFGAEFDTSELGNYRLWSDWSNTTSKTIDSELLFLERYVDWLQPGGLFLAIVPDSVLMNVGMYKELREALGKLISLEAVISLPQETFGTAGTQAKTSILAARKGKRQSSSRTYFAVCEDVGYTVSTKDSHKYKKYTNNSDLYDIINEVKYEEGNKGRYITHAEEKGRWDAKYHASLPDYVQKPLNQKSDDHIYLKDVCNIVDDRENPKRRADNHFQYIQISDIDNATGFASSTRRKTNNAPSRARKNVKAGDVLVSTVRPEKKNICMVRPEQDGCICTTGFAVLRPHGIDSLVLVNILKTNFVTAQLQRNSGGAAYPSFNESCLPKILLPTSKGSILEFEEMSTDIVDLDKKLRHARKKLMNGVEFETIQWVKENRN